MAQFDTVANVVSDAAVLCGLGTVSDVFASTDPNVVLLRVLLKQLGRKIAARREWRHLVKEHTFTTSGANTYSLPADFLRMVDQTGWDRTTRYPLGGPLDAQWWQRNKASTVNALWLAFRMRESTIELWPQPDGSGSTIAFEYMSRYWVASTVGAADKDAPTVNGDTLKLDAPMLTEGLRLAWKAEKGFDTSAALAEFEEQYGLSASASVGAAPVLSLDPAGGTHLGDERNSPSTGYGYDGGGYF